VRTLVIALLILGAIYLALVAALILSGRKVAARELATLLPNLILLFKDLARDPNVPRRAKVVLALAAVWLVSPIDLLPEFLPVLGPPDDIVVAALALRYLVRRAGAEVVRDHWRGERATLDVILQAARIPVTYVTPRSLAQASSSSQASSSGTGPRSMRTSIR
jgi:uncharacterized membrane protein YkvA (DUF1232 family)